MASNLLTSLSWTASTPKSVPLLPIPGISSTFERFQQESLRSEQKTAGIAMAHFEQKTFQFHTESLNLEIPKFEFSTQETPLEEKIADWMILDTQAPVPSQMTKDELELDVLRDELILKEGQRKQTDAPIRPLLPTPKHVEKRLQHMSLDPSKETKGPPSKKRLRFEDEADIAETARPAKSMRTEDDLLTATNIRTSATTSQSAQEKPLSGSQDLSLLFSDDQI